MIDGLQPTRLGGPCSCDIQTCYPSFRNQTHCHARLPHPKKTPPFDYSHSSVGGTGSPRGPSKLCCPRVLPIWTLIYPSDGKILGAPVGTYFSPSAMVLIDQSADPSVGLPCPKMSDRMPHVTVPVTSAFISLPIVVHTSSQVSFCLRAYPVIRSSLS